MTVSAGPKSLQDELSYKEEVIGTEEIEIGDD